MSVMRLSLAFGALALACACGKKTESEPATPAAAPAQISEVKAIDEFGPLSARINDLDFWVHPGVPFNGMAIAATDVGLVALNIEDGAEVGRVEGFKASGVEVVYENVFSLAPDEGAAGAQGLIIAYDADAKAFRFISIDNATRELKSLPTLSQGEIEADAFCAGPQYRAPTRVVVLRGAQLRTMETIEGAGGVREAVFSDPSALADEALGCVISKASGDLYVLLKDGRIQRDVMASGAREESFATSGAAAPKGVGYALNGIASDGDESDCCGQLFVLDGADASLGVVDIDDGAPLGALKLAASFDIEAVAEATAMGIGYGNYGGVYRDGAIALATNGANPVIRLAPLNGAMQALGVAMGETKNPRIENPRPLEAQCEFAGSPPPAECTPYLSSDFAVPAPQ